MVGEIFMLMQLWHAPGLRRAGALVLSFAMVAPGFAAQDAQVLPNIRHAPIPYFVPGHRVEVLAEVSDESGVETVRCYFRQKGAVAYSYVDMVPAGGDQYRGVLPAPADENGEIEYMFLVATGAGCLFRTDPFVVGAGDDEEQAAGAPEWQQVAETDVVAVGTDLEDTLAGVPGFDDAIELIAAAPDERYGITSGVYGEPEEDDDEAAGAVLPGMGGAVFCAVIPASAIVAATQIGATGAAGGGLAAVGVGIAATAGGVIAGTQDGGSSGGGGSFDPSGSCDPSEPTILSFGPFFEPEGAPAGDPWVTPLQLNLGSSPATPIELIVSIEGEAGPFCECFGDNTFQVDYEGSTIASTGIVEPGEPPVMAQGFGLGSSTELTVRVFSCNEGCDDENGHSWAVRVEAFCGSSDAPQ